MFVPRVIKYVDAYEVFWIKLVLCELYLTRVNLNKGWSFVTFLFDIIYKLCRCDH